MSAVISKFLATGSPTPYATRLCKKGLYCSGTFKNASNMTITLLTATEKMIVFPWASKQTKICTSARGKKKWESLLIFLDVPTSVLYPRVPRYYPRFIQKMANEHLSLEFKHLQGQLFAPSWCKRSGGEQLYMFSGHCGSQCFPNSL